MFLKKGTDKARNGTKGTTITCIKIGKERNRNLLLLLLGCVPGRLEGGNWFHTKGSVSLFGTASSGSDGATCDFLFFEGYLTAIGLPTRSTPGGGGGDVTLFSPFWEGTAQK